MPTDTPAAAPSQLAREMAIALLCPRPERALSLNDLSEDIAFANEQRVWDMKFAATAALLDAKLTPVREAMEYGLAWTMLSPTDKAETKMRDALASLRPQPPEAPR